MIITHESFVEFELEKNYCTKASFHAKISCYGVWFHVRITNYVYPVCRLKLLFKGEVGQWCNGSLEQLTGGSIDQWYKGSVDQLRQWFSGSVAH